MTKIACIQMASGPKVDPNLQTCRRLIADAVAKGARMAVLPEHFAHMGVNQADKLDVMESLGQGPIQKFLADTARSEGIWLVGGAIPLKTKDPKHCRSSVLVYDEKGELRGRYDKMHMFDVSLPNGEERYQESDFIEAGDDVVVVDTPMGKLGLSVCYDIRFPEIFRRQIEQGMEILAVPSAFTAITGRAHWLPLLQARAIENQCYVLASGQGGYHMNGRETYGHSMIIDPWGAVLGCLPTGSGHVMADVDLAKLRATRERFPALKHRRFGLAGKLQK
ncbi:MAG: carbon-nitrogen hydrolase family protein [Gammaproteobacteria bacterium]|nr:carbon-nitrogen hydrolase family protein [Gammaproteobacteria bacterium]